MGDISNTFSKLKVQLRRIKYAGEVDEHGYVPSLLLFPPHYYVPVGGSLVRKVVERT
jgi:hypothetical protein